MGIVSEGNGIARCGAMLSAVAAIVMSLGNIGNGVCAEKSKTYLEYISKYNKVAVREMKANGIPASITLAQGLLESGAGQSQLTKESNNHFGIKCHDWTGAKVYHDDDKLQECFRKYDTAEESFADHSLFLKRARYKSLYELEPTDYKGWARGLKKCGYATDPRYAERLIDLIEWYGLQEYDKKVDTDAIAATSTNADGEVSYVTESSMGSIPSGPYHKVEKKDGRKSIVAREGDTWKSIAKEFGMRTWELRWYNKAKRKDSVEAGRVILLRRL